MASITIDILDDDLASRLETLAAMHGHSIQDEARDILQTVLAHPPVPDDNLYASIRARIAPLGGVELPAVEREPMRMPPTLDP